MHDVLYDGRRFRTLNVIDEANRALLETGPDRHLNRGLRQDGAP